MDLTNLVQTSEGAPGTARSNGDLRNGTDGDHSMDVDHAIAHSEAGPSRGSGRLILPEWDIPPLKPLHASHDFISLLHLAPLYNTYVRPYADPLGGAGDGDDAPNGDAGGLGGIDDEGGNTNLSPMKRRGKRKKLERGYWPVLLEDIIDPVPLGESKKDHRSLLPLIPDLGGAGAGPIGAPLDLWEGEIGMIGEKELESGRLEVGLKQDGYGGGQKLGVKEAEDRRRRRKQRHSLSITSINPTIDPPQEDNAGGSGPSTPLQAVAPPSRAPLHIRNNSASGLSGGAGLPPRPTFSGVPRPPPGGSSGPFTPNFNRAKRPLDAAGGADGSAKRSKGGPSRSASPMVPGAAPGQGGQGSAQRLVVPKHGARARTEG